MAPKPLALIPMDQLDVSEETPKDRWIWDGYLARGNLTLLTSLWKTGKTTLLAGLLQRLRTGGEFLGRRCMAARVVIVSEESRDHWSERARTMPIGPHAQLLARPFLARPTPVVWRDLIDRAIELRTANELDLFVVDPLASFLPGHSECDAGTLLEMLQPLQRLAGAGAAVLLLHHPRKERSEEGSTARGSGALLGFVDIILELHRVGRLQSDARRRRLIGLSRHKRTPPLVVYEWDPTTGEFTGLGDLLGQRFRDNWKQLQAILARRERAASHDDLLMDWPADRDKPSPSVLYEWLARAHEEKLVRREGQGIRSDPYRYRLPNADDAYWDRGELPPMREIDDMG
jgi:AAA domain